MKRVPLLLTWSEVERASATHPLRMTEAPGPALLRQNLSWIRTAADPRPADLLRVKEARPRALYLSSTLPRLTELLATAHRLASHGLPPTAVRGRHVPAQWRRDFAELSLEAGLLPLLEEAGGPLPERWAHPIVVTEVYHPRYANLRLGTVLSRLPEPGTLAFSDLGRAGIREGAVETALDQELDDEALRRLLGSLSEAGLEHTLLVDNGGPVAELAEQLLRRGRLGAYFGPACRPPPPAVREAGVSVWTWLEPEDLSPGRLAELPAVRSGVAFLPVGLRRGSIPSDAAHAATLRERGYGAVVPRCHLPVPNTREWQELEAACSLRVRDFRKLDSRHLVFALPAYGPAEGPELLMLLARSNQWPEPPRAAGSRRRRVSFMELRQTLDSYLVDAGDRVDDCHAQDVIGELVEALSHGSGRLDALDEYPFVAVDGRSLSEIVEGAIEARLRSMGDAPLPLIRAIQHASLTGGKRIRPIVTLIMTTAYGVPLEAAMPAALSTEWIHTASLIQDDLPLMDDDDVRRRELSTHRRFGEGLALLASDALIAMAVEDVAALAEHPEVGPLRASRLLRFLCRAIGGRGLVGGQVRDLISRHRESVDLQDVLEIHRHKTVPLFRLTAELAVVLGDVPEPHASELIGMLASMGLAFQIIDDILDATPGNEDFGRPAGSDDKNRLPTFATLAGSRLGRRYAEQVLAPYMTIARGRPGLAGLSRLARFVLDRRR